MIVDVREIPVTFRAVLVEFNNAYEIDELLEDTEWDVRLKDGTMYLVEPQPSYEKYGYVENRSTVSLWNGDWIVVSSVGEVRKLTTEQYTKEFEEV